MEVQSVQEIASQSLNIIPSEFIRTKDEHPEITTLHGEFLQVPVIDIGSDSDMVRKISEASTEWGIFQAVNHGIPENVIGNVKRAGEEFFELPLEEKLLVAEDPETGSGEGYGSNFLKKVKGNRGWVDFLFYRLWPPSAINFQFWPKKPPSFREANEEYVKKLHSMANKMFECLSMGLGLEPYVMKEALGGDDRLIYRMKINYYPPCLRPDLVLGVAAHTDISAITILVPNEVPGLQVFKNDQWYGVNYTRNALIVLVGKQIEVLSNGKYMSVLHRSTVSKDKTRMSWAVFLEPPPEQEIRPISELINGENPAKFMTKKYRDYVYCKMNNIPQ